MSFDNPWPYQGYQPFTFDDLYHVGSGAISGDGYIVPCEVGNGHALAWNDLPEDHPYRIWAKNRWVPVVEHVNKLRDDPTNDWRIWSDILPFERAVISGKFYHMHGIRVVLFSESIHIEGTKIGIQHQQGRIQTLNEKYFEGNARIEAEITCISQDELAEFDQDIARALR